MLNHHPYPRSIDKRSEQTFVQASQCSQGSYPGQYEEWITVKNNKKVFLRPVRPTDGSLINDFVSRLSDVSKYYRFLRRVDTLRPDMLRKFVHLDYKREFALAAVVCEGGANVIIGVCRYSASLFPSHAESAIVVRDDWHGSGLGKAMTLRVFAIAKLNGISTIVVNLDQRNDIAVKLYTGLGYLYQYRPSFIDISDSIDIHLSKFVL
jgi:acetyltransferase